MRSSTLFLVLTITSWCAPALAVEKCKASVSAADGTIYVSGRDVQGVLTWGDTYGAETQAIFNYPACVKSGVARKCVLGDVGTPERTTTPPSCTLFLTDGAGNRCETFIRRCTYQPPALPCDLFPADNIWNADVSALPVHPLSDAYIASIGSTVSLKADFGAGLYRGSPIGIPFTVAPSIYPRVPVEFLYADESDPGPYPISPNAPIEGGTGPGRGKGDRHILIVESGTCTLFEVFDAHSRRRGTSWKAGSGAVWDLDSHALRPTDWTSADAAGLPILPGLARYDEILAGSIDHALRFTTPQTQRAYVWPGRHFASSSTDPTLPPLGIRVRLKAGFDISSFSATNQVILTALKEYGMMLADNGSRWFVSGAPDSRWNNDDLRDLARVTGADFEVVDVSSLIVDPDSGQTP